MLPGHLAGCCLHTCQHVWLAVDAQCCLLTSDSSQLIERSAWNGLHPKSWLESQVSSTWRTPLPMVSFCAAGTHLQSQCVWRPAVGSAGHPANRRPPAVRRRGHHHVKHVSDLLLSPVVMSGSTAGCCRLRPSADSCCKSTVPRLAVVDSCLRDTTSRGASLLACACKSEA